MIDDLKNAGVDELRMKLFVNLEEVKVTIQDSLLLREQLSSRERAQLTSSLIKIVHEQALLVGAHAAKQIAVADAGNVVNEEAMAYAKDVVRFMELSEKMAAANHGRSRLTADDADAIIDADLVEPTVPDLLRQFEAEATCLNRNPCRSTSVQMATDTQQTSSEERSVPRGSAAESGWASPQSVEASG